MPLNDRIFDGVDFIGPCRTFTPRYYSVRINVGEDSITNPNPSAALTRLREESFEMPDLEFLQAHAHRRNLNAIEAAREYQRRFEEEPSYEERQERCELMGMIFCSCTRVPTPEGERIIHDPNCKVCNHFTRLP